MTTGGKRCCRWVWSGALVLARSISLVGWRRGSNDDAGRSADPRARSACPRGVYREGRQDRTNHNSIINEAALLEVTPCEGVSVAAKIHSPWISGRAPSRVAATGRRPRLGPCGPLQRAALAGSGAIYSMTRSASSSNEFGICMPICCAACRLITSSKRVGSSTGRVAGSAPLAILST